MDSTEYITKIKVYMTSEMLMRKDLRMNPLVDKPTGMYSEMEIFHIRLVVGEMKGKEELFDHITLSEGPSRTLE